MNICNMLLPSGSPWSTRHTQLPSASWRQRASGCEMPGTTAWSKCPWRRCQRWSDQPEKPSVWWFPFCSGYTPCKNRMIPVPLPRRLG